MPFHRRPPVASRIGIAPLPRLAGETSKRLGMTRRRFLASSAGMATAFVAMNEVYGRFFDVNPLEMLGPAHARATFPRISSSSTTSFT